MSRKRSIVVGPNSFLALSAAIFLIASFVTGPASAIADDATADQVIPSTRCRGLWIVPLTFGEDGDHAGNELWRKDLKPYRKFNVVGTDRTTALEYRANELAKKLAKACNKGWRR